MKRVSEHVPDNILKEAYYWHPSPNDSQFAIFLDHNENRTDVKITEFDTGQFDDQNNIPFFGERMLCMDDGKDLVSIEIWCKYFFPTFSDDMQLYHSWGIGNTCDMQNLFDVMRYAYDLAFEKNPNLKKL